MPRHQSRRAATASPLPTHIDGVAELSRHFSLCSKDETEFRPLPLRDKEARR